MTTVKYRPNPRPQFWRDSYGIFAANDDGETYFHPSLLVPIGVLSILLNGAPTIMVKGDGVWVTLMSMSWARVALARMPIDFGALEAFIKRGIAQERGKWREFDGRLLSDV
jgi:hypothetical protein